MAYGFDGVNYTQFVTMSGSQLDAFNTTPFQLIAAPGANKVIMLRRIQTIFIQTGPNFYTADSAIAMCWNNTPMSDPPDTNTINPSSTTAGHPIYSIWDAWGRLQINAFDLSVGINQPVKVQSNFDWISVGQIVTSHLSNAGTAYNPGDTGSLAGSSNIVYTVDTVTGRPPGPIAVSSYAVRGDWSSYRAAAAEGDDVQLGIRTFEHAHLETFGGSLISNVGAGIRTSKRRSTYLVSNLDGWVTRSAETAGSAIQVGENDKVGLRSRRSCVQRKCIPVRASGDRIRTLEQRGPRTQCHTPACSD